MQKIKSLTFLFFIINCQWISAQKYSFDAPYKYISPQNEVYSGDKKFNFSGITIIDARADTSKVGFSITGIKIYDIKRLTEIKRLNYQNGLSADVTNYLLNFYKHAFEDNGDTVLIVIKKLWISQYDTTLSIGSNFIGSGRIFLTKLKLEFYLKDKEFYHPINRFDTSFITTPKRSTKDFGYEITDAIINCCDNLFTLNPVSILQRKKYTLEQIQQFNNRLFDIPVLNAAKYKKGIYVTFSEFLNNEPSLDYSNIDKQKYGDVLYLNDGNGGEYSSNKFWGYSDGENLYIISGKNFFQLVRTQNTFEFFGIKNLRENFAFNGDILKKGKPTLNKFIYQVDMETGESY